jgi:hypothetical protein
MQVELYNEISTMIKYKAERDHWHGFTWGVLIFLFISTMGMASTINDLKARVAYLEQRVGIENAQER